MRSLEADADHDSEYNHWQTIRALAPYLWPHGRSDLKARVVISLTLLVLAKVIGVYVPFLFKDAVNALSPSPQLDAVTTAIAVPVGLIVAYGIARVLSQAFGELRDAVFVRVGLNALREVAINVFDHLHKLSLRFHLERQTGGLSRVIERGTKGIDFLLRFMLFNILPTLLELVIISVAFWINFGVLYAVVTFVSLSGYILFTVKVTDWRLKYRREMNREDNEANTKAIDSLINFETVKYFNNEHHEVSRFNSAMRRYEEAGIKSQTSLAFLNIGQGLIISVGLITVMLMAASEIATGQLTIGDFVLANALLIQIYMPLNFLGFVYREIKQSLVDMEKMFTLLEQKEEVEDKAAAPDLELRGAEVRFENVDFFYDKDRQILKDISFTVPAGTMTAIVGASGAGKSTISRILYRFYDIAAGRVMVDGQDIRDITQASLRQAIGIVPQDTVLFNDTIMYNIRYGRPDASDEEVISAAKMAHIHEFVAQLPDQYETMVGERGLKLSGGEKQRVAIARTILKNPGILLLDEATSALDTHTEREIQSSLKSIAKERTSLVIAHRLSTVVDANEILVLEKGQVVERGKHQALLALDGKYAAMWKKQQEAAVMREHLADLENAMPQTVVEDTPKKV
ncbi:MAG: metal ABC transporter permease [Kordiimonas sp.]|nr:metal ABC transporter permease [Kordiimonas sp.]|tara:strand:- start:620 stop:2506 length:1887 start_codon:yes stop_codon:yes gene_type:complete